MATNSPNARSMWLSDQLIRVVQLVFAVVIAQSFLLYKDIVINPFTRGHYIAALALLGLYLTTIWSWMGWHAAMSYSPYLYRKDDDSTNWTEHLRVFSDLAIVVLYAHMLFRIEPFTKDPSADVRLLLIGYPFIFLLYLISGQLRIVTHGPEASRHVPLFGGFAAFSLLVAIYYLAQHYLLGSSSSRTPRIWLNGVTLALVIVLMIAYRLFNDWYRAYGRRRQHICGGPQVREGT